MNEKFRLDGRSALVTGAGRGIGRACAIALAQAGAEVWLAARTRDEIDAAAAEIRAAGGHAHAVACDVTNTNDVKNVFSSIPALDVLVNNAGSNIPEPFVEVSEDHLDRLLDLNVRAAFLVAQAAAKKMLEAPERRAPEGAPAVPRGGVILNMSSQMGHVGAANRSVYCLTKHALEGLTKAMALELAAHNIRVVAIAPTFIITPMTRPMMARPDFAQWVRERIPAGRVGQVEEVAAAVVFAASPAASFMTGSSLLIDGGWTAQ
ncbi:MAG: SDR family oxidoreductase [Betaproteobacteria bacterium]|nr:MAG: SDR family oxidoreductase [Betaproteobacteria bacterium]